MCFNFKKAKYKSPLKYSNGKANGKQPSAMANNVQLSECCILTMFKITWLHTGQ